MPTNNKKVFQIEINGLTQSVDAVQALNNQLDDLEKRIKRLQNAKLEVKVSGNDTAQQSNTVVSGNNSTRNQTNALNELAKLQQQVSRQQARNEALLTEEYREQLRAKIQLNEENKQAERLIREQVQGIRDENGEYTNTLAGLRARLNEEARILSTLQAGTEEYQKQSDEVQRLRTIVSQMEQATGDFRRNVGNYASAAKGFTDLADGVRQYDNSINGLNARISDLREAMKSLDFNTDDFRRMSDELREVQGRLREVQSGAESAGNAMEEKLGVRFQTVIGGISYTFDDVNQGIGLLEDKLYSMAQAGDTTSKEFREISQEIARLRNSVVSVDSAIDQMIGTSKGLRNITSIFTGFAGIASLGQGLQGLFGGQNADLDESIQKFTSLSMVMQGLIAIQQQMAQENTTFTRILRTVNDRINGVLGGFDNYIQKVTAARDISRDFGGSVSNYFGEAFMNILDVVNKAGSEISTKFENILETLGELPQNKKLSLTELFTLDDDALRSKYNGMKKDFGDMLVDFRNEAKNANIFEELQAATDNWINSINTVGKMNGFTRWLSSGTIAAKAFAVAIRGVTIALQALSKALIITALIQALIWAIEKATQAIGWLVDGFKNLIGDTGDVIDSSNLLQGTLERQREEWERLSEAVDKARESTGKYKTEMDAFKNSINEAGKQLKDFVIGVDRMEQLGENLDAGMGFFSTGKFGGVDSIDEFRKEYENLMKVVQQGQDRFRGEGFGGFWNTQADAMEDLANAQRAVIKDFMYQIDQINFDKPEQAVQEFRKLIDDEMYASALSNIEELFPEEEWAKNLNLMVQHYSEAIDMMKEKDDELVESAREASEEVARQLRDINTYNMQFEPGQWRFGYERQSLKDQYEDERKEAEGNAELLAAIDKKYYNDRRELIRRQAQEIKQVNFEIQQNELDAQKEGLDKRLAQLELSRQQELNSAKQGDINVQEQIASINKKYDAQILAEKEAFYQQQVQAAEERNQAILDMEQQMLEQDLQMQRQLAQTRNATAGTQLENQNYSVTTTVSYNVESTGGDGLAERKQYYDTLLQYQQDYINQKEKLDLEAAKQSTQTQIEDNQSNYESQLRELDNFYKERQKVLDDNLEQGLVSQEEYNNEMAQLSQMLAERETQLQQQANAQQIALVEQGEAEQTRIMNEANEERLNANSEYLNQMTDSLNDYYSEINSARRSTSRENTNSLGIINYKAEKENLQNTLKEYNNLMSNIDSQYAQLQSKFENNEISFNDFTQAKSELDSLRQKTEQSVKQTQNALDNLINTVAGSVMNMINGYMGAFSDIWSMVSDLRENQLEAEEERLERQQEILDEELEAIEEAYEKQEEVTQSHRDKINDIEGELSTARGDRRQALIEQLAKEREAELQSLKTEQDIQKQKQANEKKQQALEKQQEALDKKRWEQNKQNQIVQATINTFVAVSNALAVQPWFVGLALSAVALALGMANVAKISAQKYMADGGLLTGKSHAQGGIPVGTTGIEVEGNEYVVNKNTTMKNLPLLEYINSQRRPLTKEDLVNFYDDGKGRRLVSSTLTKKYAEGGQLPEGISSADIRRLVNYEPEQDNRPIVVSVVDIVNATENLREVEALAGVGQ